MAYDYLPIRGKLDHWQAYMESFSLPEWENLPDMELYMDQVVSLVARYLDLLPHGKDEQIVTPSAINNYVRLKVMPAPQRKRYGRRHLAYVIMICALKQVMTLTEIQKLIPVQLEEARMRQVYNEFVRKLTTTTQLFIDQVNAVASQVLLPQNDHGSEDLVLHSAVSSMLYKLLTVKLCGLPPVGETEQAERAASE